jgi:hypothetical protein
MKLTFIFSILFALIIAVFSRSHFRRRNQETTDVKPKVNGGFSRNPAKVEKFKKKKDPKLVKKVKKTTLLR